MIDLEILFIRHGETNWSSQILDQGPQDLPLNDQGIRQVTLTAEQLVEENIDIIYSSDLLRAKQTTEIIQDHLRIKPEILFVRNLQERYYGDFGKAKNLSNDALPDDAEPKEIFENRTKSTLRKIIEQSKSKNKILITGHAGVFKSFCEMLEIEKKNINYAEIVRFNIRR